MIYCRSIENYLKKNKGADIEEVLSYCFKNFGDGIFPITHKDKEFKEQQCHSARRSFTDLHEIAETYFGKIDKKDFSQIMYNLYVDHSIYPYFCEDINKVVFKCWGTVTYPSDSYGLFHMIRTGWQNSSEKTVGTDGLSAEDIFSCLEGIKPL